jgi:uncharacterized protein YndB with AHSA1/START domain
MTTPDDQSRPPRSIELDVEVPGTPEEVWEAIATGPGISAWMHPTEVEEREGGRFTFDMGSGPRHGTVTGWDPPRRFAERTQWEASADAPAATIATEWTVEARAGGTCVVRMVMSGFASGADWDDEVDGVTEGMRLALDNLRRHLTHFPGERGAWARGLCPGDRLARRDVGGAHDRARPGRRRRGRPLRDGPRRAAPRRGGRPGARAHVAPRAAAAPRGAGARDRARHRPRRGPLDDGAGVLLRRRRGGGRRA